MRPLSNTTLTRRKVASISARAMGRKTGFTGSSRPRRLAPGKPESAEFTAIHGGSAVIGPVAPRRQDVHEGAERRPVPELQPDHVERHPGDGADAGRAARSADPLMDADERRQPPARAVDVPGAVELSHAGDRSTAPDRPVADGGRPDDHSARRS